MGNGNSELMGAKEAFSEGVGLVFVVNVLCFYLEVIVRGKSRTEYPYKRPSYEATQKHAFSTPLGRDYSKHLLLVLLLSFHHVTFLFSIFTLVLFFDQIFFFSSFWWVNIEITETQKLEGGGAGRGSFWNLVLTEGEEENNRNVVVEVVQLRWWMENNRKVVVVVDGKQ